MKRKIIRKVWVACGFLAAFVAWTAAVCLVDVQRVGPEGSWVGFARVNGWFHGLTGVNMALYYLTDWLSLVPLLLVAGFGLLGLWQWIRRKRLFQVDGSILALGGFYGIVMAAFLLFEVWPVNYRPVLIQGQLEASYPSSTTMLVLCVMPTAIYQFSDRIRNRVWRRWVLVAMGAFTVFMVVARAVSGVHWLTDILGGALLSAGLIMLYSAVCTAIKK